MSSRAEQEFVVHRKSCRSKQNQDKSRCIEIRCWELQIHDNEIRRPGAWREHRQE
jgi:hypothetical protein